MQSICCLFCSISYAPSKWRSPKSLLCLFFFFFFILFCVWAKFCLWAKKVAKMSGGEQVEMVVHLGKRWRWKKKKKKKKEFLSFNSLCLSKTEAKLEKKCLLSSSSVPKHRVSEWPCRVSEVGQYCSLGLFVCPFPQSSSQPQTTQTLLLLRRLSTGATSRHGAQTQFGSAKFSVRRHHRFALTRDCLCSFGQQQIELPNSFGLLFGNSAQHTPVHWAFVLEGACARPATVALGQEKQQAGKACTGRPRAEHEPKFKCTVRARAERRERDTTSSRPFATRPAYESLFSVPFSQVLFMTARARTVYVNFGSQCTQDTHGEGVSHLVRRIFRVIVCVPV